MHRLLSDLTERVVDHAGNRTTDEMRTMLLEDLWKQVSPELKDDPFLKVLFRWVARYLVQEWIHAHRSIAPSKPVAYEGHTPDSNMRPRRMTRAEREEQDQYSQGLWERRKKFDLRVNIHGVCKSIWEATITDLEEVANKYHRNGTAQFAIRDFLLKLKEAIGDHKNAFEAGLSPEALEEMSENAKHQIGEI